MSLHKLTAGSGYDYLTRQVAALDSTEKGHTSLASYYTEKGEVSGRWVGSGLDGIDGLSEGDVVTAEQMKSLFAFGHHPLAPSRVSALGPHATEGERRAAERLGVPFKVFTPDASAFQIEVARRVTALDSEGDIDADVRARIRSEVAHEFFVAEHGRAPADERELSAVVATQSRPRTTAVAGFDLTFSPVKSVSTLWALADPATAAKVESAHNAAVSDALTFIESHALYTREGARGVRQVDTRGLVAAAFTHRDSRAGDPDLHTHVAVANKVQTLSGKWLAIDGRVLFKAKVSASEVYNTALEKHLTRALGVRFAERSQVDRRKRPVREIVGIDAALNVRWSSRRLSIESRQAVLAVEFQRDHGRPPSPVEAIQLAQRATLETRDAKHEPRTLDEQRAAWWEQAIDSLGDEESVARMLSSALSPRPSRARTITPTWVATMSSRALDEVQSRRSTWQVWHLTAEAHRQVRAQVDPHELDRVVAEVVTMAVERSVAISPDPDPVSEPASLRRRDGSSVYTVAGSDLFTSATVLGAEQRIVAAAGRVDGMRATEGAVDLALLEAAAGGVDLNVGQVDLVRAMASSGVRVQLGIAAAGTGKTTAMSVLARAWEESGGTVVGLAPSAAAAAALGAQVETRTDTLAKLTTEITSRRGGPIADGIGETSLVLIDEAGMADTLTLDTVIGFAISRGASVRLIGDDQQLAAIGAGGVLRDIQHTHGAVQLTELMRFSDPAERAATLGLRDGRPDALGFYLDQQRVHVGGLESATRQAFGAWNTDRNSGLDSIMLAPTREIAAELNSLARTARVADGHVDNCATARLCDQNLASVGDVILTRRNDRSLRVSPTDWVKNGDRWIVTAVDQGALRARHTRSGLTVSLPAEYVASSTELGYATTVHAAQGVSVDTTHGVVTGDETRQQLYTLLTRGRLANHAYVVTTTDGDPHGLIRPETVHPQTAVDVLTDVLARDGAPLSATSTARAAVDPATQLGHATARYIDALLHAIEQTTSPTTISALEESIDALVPDLTSEPAWPTLRGHLLLLRAHGADPLHEVQRALAGEGLHNARDRSAVIEWRLDTTRSSRRHVGPLPWLPGVPDPLVNDPTWGPYLVARAERIRTLTAAVVAHATTADQPGWATAGRFNPDIETLVDVAVWRAANQVDPSDQRPTGPPVSHRAAARHQRSLERKWRADRTPAIHEWGWRIDAVLPKRDSFTPLLAQRLASLSRAGIDAGELLTTVANERPLPDEHAAAALWWRITRHLTAHQTATHDAPDIDWFDVLRTHLGHEEATNISRAARWPELTAALTNATAIGWAPDDLVSAANASDLDDVDHVDAMLWRISVLTNPPPEDGFPKPTSSEVDLPPAAEQVLPDLEDLARARLLMDPPEPTDAEINLAVARAWEIDSSPVPLERIHEINERVATLYEQAFPDSWAHEHLTSRLRADLTGDPRFRPGYAPAGWTLLTDQLRRDGYTDDELVAAGISKTASTGNLIDRFRDRLVLPIISNGKVLGFVGRRHPESTSEHDGPKYLNTPDTIAFHKGAQLFGLADDTMTFGAIPVLVEGPIDAMAVTVASGGAYLGVAPLGTALTTEQAAQLAPLGPRPIIATDGDAAGNDAARRAFWLLAPRLSDPQRATFSRGDDPAQIASRDGHDRLVSQLQDSMPALASLTAAARCHDEIIALLAASPPARWTHQSLTTLAPSTRALSRKKMKQKIERFNADPLLFCESQLGTSVGRPAPQGSSSGRNAVKVYGRTYAATRLPPSTDRRPDL